MSDSDIEFGQSMPKKGTYMVGRLPSEAATVSVHQQQVINAGPVLIKALLIALLGESQKLLCSLTDSWAEAWVWARFTATLHERVRFDVAELRCKTAFEPCGKLRRIIGYCS